MSRTIEQAAPAREAETAVGERRGRPRRSPTLTRRIVISNVIGLALLVGGVLYLNQFRAGLIDLRAESLRTQGAIIAAAIADAAAEPTDETFDPVRANEVLRTLARPAGVRARIFDASGRLTGDTRSFEGVAVETQPLPSPAQVPDLGLVERLQRLWRRLAGRVSPDDEIYSETPIAGVATAPEVYEALEGESATSVRVNSEGELIVSVSVPIQPFKVVLGALVLSTEGGDIDAIVRAERIQILQVFAVALAVSAALSLILANTIARPIRQLADAAERGGALDPRPINPQRIRIPDFTSRPDEIGHLSGALRRMTEALYARLEAIERFAADVAHEIKNPLTSLRSAVETMRRAERPEMRARLLEVIEHDVRRLDRLVTDISNASRLDAELVREERGEVDLRAVLSTVAQIAAARGDDRAAVVTTRLPTAPLVCRGIEGRLAQVFQNLVDNALSFSPEAGVVTVWAGTTPAGSLRVTVEDEGPGVPKGNLEAIFGRFYSERPEHESFGQHSGLGLSIAKQIVEAHGGRIWAENRRRAGAPRNAPPDGARFVVELPR